MEVNLFGITFLFLTSLLTCRNAHGQTSRMMPILQGIVHDENGHPVIGGDVSLFAKGQFVGGATTDFDGHYEINLDPGYYDVQFSYIGYLSKRYECVQINQKDTTTLNVVFAESYPLCERVTTKCKLGPLWTRYRNALDSGASERTLRVLERRARRADERSKPELELTPAQRKQCRSMRRAETA